MAIIKNIKYVGNNYLYCRNLHRIRFGMGKVTKGYGNRFLFQFHKPIYYGLDVHRMKTIWFEIRLYHFFIDIAYWKEYKCSTLSTKEHLLALLKNGKS